MNIRTTTLLKFHSYSFVNGFTATNDEQVTEPFKRIFVLMNESDISGSGEFLRFLNSFKPQLILDLRLSPRLDFVSGSRAHTFRAFSKFAVRYVDVFGRLGICSRDELLTVRGLGSNILERIVEIKNDDGRPVVCLFDDSDVISQCKKIFRSEIVYYLRNKPRPNVSSFKSGLLAVQ